MRGSSAASEDVIQFVCTHTPVYTCMYCMLRVGVTGPDPMQISYPGRDKANLQVLLVLTGLM